MANRDALLMRDITRSRRESHKSELYPQGNDWIPTAWHGCTEYGVHTQQYGVHACLYSTLSVDWQHLKQRPCSLLDMLTNGCCGCCWYGHETGRDYRLFAVIQPFSHINNLTRLLNSSISTEISTEVACRFWIRQARICLNSSVSTS